MEDLVTDTHGLIWYLEDDRRLSQTARDRFDMCDRGEIDIFVPTICLVEIIYLGEKFRIPQNLQDQVYEEIGGGETGLIPVNLSPAIVLNLPNIPRAVVPDMPDRIIAATAVHLNLKLITRDRNIHRSDIDIIW